MRTVKVRNITIGEGIPKIIVPLVALSEQKLLDEVNYVMAMKPDLIEWRVDRFDAVENLVAVKRMLKLLREQIKDTLLLFTFRTVNEGGKRKVSMEYYQELVDMAVSSKLIDLVDIELFLAEDLVKELVSQAKENNVAVVLSSHDFEKTPDKAELLARFQKMQEFGADIPKLAVMPNNARDLVTLLDATEEIKVKYADRPFITISMGETGLISRIAGEVFGSAATFASGMVGSAPGQIPVLELRKVLELIHFSN